MHAKLSVHGLSIAVLISLQLMTPSASADMVDFLTNKGTKTPVKADGKAQAPGKAKAHFGTGPVGAAPPSNIPSIPLKVFPCDEYKDQYQLARPGFQIDQSLNYVVCSGETVIQDKAKQLCICKNNSYKIYQLTSAGVDPGETQDTKNSKDAKAAPAVKPDENAKTEKAPAAKPLAHETTDEAKQPKKDTAAVLKKDENPHFKLMTSDGKVLAPRTVSHEPQAPEKDPVIRKHAPKSTEVAKDAPVKAPASHPAATPPAKTDTAKTETAKAERKHAEAKKKSGAAVGEKKRHEGANNTSAACAVPGKLDPMALEIAALKKKVDLLEAELAQAEAKSVPAAPPAPAATVPAATAPAPLLSKDSVDQAVTPASGSDYGHVTTYPTAESPWGPAKGPSPASVLPVKPPKVSESTTEQYDY